MSGALTRMLGRNAAAAAVAIQYQSRGTFSASAGTTSRALGLPTVNGQNGILIAVAISSNNATHNSTTTGWTKFAQLDAGATHTASIWIASESVVAGVTVTWSGAAAASGQIYYFSDPTGIPVLTTISVSSSNANLASPHTCPGFVTDSNNILGVYIDTTNSNGVHAQPTGWIEQSDQGSATSGQGIGLGTQTFAVSGTNTGSISMSGSTRASTWQIELKS
jgi:hypothetical protein